MNYEDMSYTSNQYNNSSDGLVEESYYGKLPEFVEMEKLFDTIIAKSKKEGLTKCNPNNYKEHKRICSLFCKLFGFKKALIYWEPYSEGNAFTYSLNAFIVFSDKSKMIKKTEKGFYDSSHSIILTVYITTGLIELGLSSRELIAVILHEIGHNFDYSTYHKFDAFISSILTLGSTAVTINKYKDNLNDIKLEIDKKIKKQDNDIYNKQKTRDKLSKNWYKNITSRIKYNAVYNAIMMPINTIVDVIYVGLCPLYTINNLAGKKGELFADSFATAYGYGSELITSLKTLGDLNKFYDPKSHVMKFFMDLSKLQSEIVISLIDVHGTDMERCQECIEKLKYDLKHNEFQPELKKELAEEINKMTMAYKAFSKFDKNEKYKITKLARKICAVLFRGKPNIIKFFKRNKV